MAILSSPFYGFFFCFFVFPYSHESLITQLNIQVDLLHISWILSLQFSPVKTLASLVLLDSNVLCCDLDTLCSFSKMEKSETHFVYSLSVVSVLRSFVSCILFIVVWDGRINLVLVILPWSKVEGHLLFHCFVCEIKFM